MFFQISCILKVFGQISGLRPDIFPDARYPAGYQILYTAFDGYPADRRGFLVSYLALKLDNLEVRYPTNLMTGPS